MVNKLNYSGWRSPVIVLIAGCLVAAIGFGVRSSFGLFLEPITMAREWSRETFSLALAFQNLMWGIGLPVAGMLADKFGPVKVIIAGAFIYASGILGMILFDGKLAFQFTAGLITGLGIAFTAFSLALAAMVRVVGENKRSLVLGLGTAAGSFGQVIFSPISQGFISAWGWSPALLILAGSLALLIPFALVLPNNTSVPGYLDVGQSLRQALAEALGHRGYVLLTTGFFVCGFHVAFITVHFPAYVIDLGLDPIIGAHSISIVGLMNIAGCLAAGYFGQHWSKKNGLSVIYFSRAIIIICLILAPKTAMTIYLFAAGMGVLWLSTVPLTTGIVAQVFGVRYMATLFGIVFLSHQCGSFLGVWLVGRIYDATGSYDGMWWAGVMLAVLSALVHLPINEKPLRRLTADA